MKNLLRPSRKTAISCFVLTSLLLGVSSYGHSQSLESDLKAKYELTKTGTDRIRITQPGTILVIRKNGISADLASDLTFLNNKVSNGQVAQAGGFAAAMQDKKTSRVLKAGDRVYLFKLEAKDNEVRYFLLTCDTYDVNNRGSTRQTRYKALVTFQFPNDFLKSADADAVKKVVDEIVAPESDAVAANTKTVSLGQSAQEVESILGKPDKIFDLGQKKTYVYKDIKVIFTDGKVADVQ